MHPKITRARGSLQAVVASSIRVLEALLGTQRPSGMALESLLHEAIRTASRSSADSARHSETHDSALILDTSNGIESLTDLGFYEGTLAEILATAKYRAWPEPLVHLGHRLGRELQATASWLSDSGGMQGRTLVVPVPSPRLRRWHRGLDHTAILARGVAQVIGGDTRSLFARRWSKPQMSLSRRSRREVGSSLQLRRGAPRALQRWRSVLIVDDVTTSGATLAAMAKALREAGAGRVHACVVASGRSGHDSASPSAGRPSSWGVRGG
ncbi:MAG: phosphoribosyltransferase family protein [Phycisphaerales bacterium]|jgi:predicted amidophosphoribosyltransferase|nr:phosphoribosyltransferase family protein [Phycisphaerales bacterium]